MHKKSSYGTYMFSIPKEESSELTPEFIEESRKFFEENKLSEKGEKELYPIGYFDKIKKTRCESKEKKV